MEQAASHKSELLALAREIAVECARRLGTITADDVQFELHRRGYSVLALGNAAGSIFTDKSKWQWTGDYKRSVRANAKGNMLRCWRYVGKN